MWSRVFLHFVISTCVFGTLFIVAFLATWMYQSADFYHTNEHFYHEAVDPATQAICANPSNVLYNKEHCEDFHLWASHESLADNIRIKSFLLVTGAISKFFYAVGNMFGICSGEVCRWELSVMFSLMTRMGYLYLFAILAIVLLYVNYLNSTEKRLMAQEYTHQRRVDLQIHQTSRQQHAVARIPHQLTQRRAVAPVVIAPEKVSVPRSTSPRPAPVSTPPPLHMIFAPPAAAPSTHVEEFDPGYTTRAAQDEEEGAGEEGVEHSTSRYALRSHTSTTLPRYTNHFQLPLVDVVDYGRKDRSWRPARLDEEDQRRFTHINERD